MTNAAAPRVVVVPDKFRGSLTALEAAAAIGLGIRDAIPDAEVIARPAADGGEGTVAALLASGARPVPYAAYGPLREAVSALMVSFADEVIIETAQVCGLGLLPEGPSPHTALSAGSWGVGSALAQAATLLPAKIAVALGGSACTDGGFGALHALGYVALDRRGRQITELSGMSEVWRMLPGPRPIEADVVVACDVLTPLVGLGGTVATFAAQKGAGPVEKNMLSRRIESWASVLERSFGVDVSTLPGGGAAGGIAAGLVAALDATIVSGAELILSLVGLDELIPSADLVITGEGSLDDQSLEGKLPFVVAQMARSANVPVTAIAGRVDCSQTVMFDSVTDVVSSAGRGEDPFQDAPTIVRRLARENAASWVRQSGT
jgi:glycerate kinase